MHTCSRGTACPLRLQFREVLGSKKYVPMDLRRKKTRAIRHALSKTEVRMGLPPLSARCVRSWLTHGMPRAQAKKKTLRQQKKLAYFPMRKYAVKA